MQDINLGLDHITDPSAQRVHLKIPFWCDMREFFLDHFVMGHVCFENTECTTALDKIKHQMGMSFHTYNLRTIFL